jgi:LemA protein
MNKKGGAGIIILGVVGAILLIVFIVGAWVAGAYNSLVNIDTTVENKWGNVESAYQRRADLIPNIVETVKGVANFEKSTYIGVADARTNWQNAKTTDEKIQAGQQMDSALARLLVTMEAYPQLKANQNFIALQDELAGTENRIKYERDDYNTAVKNFKQAVRSFPTNILAGMFGFQVNKWAMFEAEKGAEKAPKVNFTQ